MQAPASSEENKNATDVDDARSSVEFCFDLDALPTESESEATCIESNEYETSELSCNISDSEKLLEMYDIGEVLTNAEKGEDENIQCEEEVQDSGRFLLAAKHSHVEVARSLLMQSAESTLDAFDEKQNTTLHCAAAFGHEDAVDLLLSNKSKVYCRNPDDQTPLHLASKNGHFETVEALIRYGGHVKSLLMQSDESYVDTFEKKQNTPLHCAAAFGHKDVVDLILSNKSKVYCRNSDDQTPLHLASKETKNADRVDKARSSAELCFELDALPTESESESSSNESNWSETSELSCITSDFEEQVELYGNGDVVTNAEKGKDESVQGFSEEDEVQDSGRLLLASKRGHVEVVRSLLRQSAESDVDTIDAKQNTPLHFAAAFGHKDVVDLLLSKNSTVDCRNADNLTPLHLASYNGHEKIVEALIHNGAAVNACNSVEMTPLHLAAQKGRTSIVRILLDNHAIVDVVKQSKKTPFYLAAENGHAEVVDDLLSRGHSDFIALRWEIPPPLHVAIEKCHEKVVEVILKYSGRTSKKISEDEDELQDNVGNLVETRNITPVKLKNSDGRLVFAEIVWIETHIPIEIMRDLDRDNALDIAVLSIQPKIVEMLLHRDKCVYSEKHLAGSFRLLKLRFFKTDANKLRSIKKMAEFLVNSERFNVNDQDGALCTPLHDVVKKCENCSCEYLTIKLSKEPLQIQTINDIINLLLQKGADFNMRNCYGETALILASQNGCLHTVQTLLDWQHKTGIKLDLDARDQFGATALIKAAEIRHVEVMKLLLKNKASVNLHDYYGYTALHAAIYEPKNRNWSDLLFFCKGQNLRYDEVTTPFKEEMVKLLLSLDETNVNATDFIGNTPLDLAVKSFMRISEATFNELKNHGAIQKRRESKDEAPVHVAGMVDERGGNPLHRLIISQISEHAIEHRIAVKRELDHEWLDLMAEGFRLKPKNFKHLSTGKDEKERTPLHYAVMPQSYSKRNQQLVSKLLELGCMVNAPDIYGKTPLHYAEMNDDNYSDKYLTDENTDSDNYNMLLNYGADETIKDRYGYTPRDLKQLRDDVKKSAHNSKQLPIRMKKIYVSSEIKTNHMKELAKQKLPTTIKIFSQSSRRRRLESAEKAIGKICMKNKFFRLNRRLSHLKTHIHQFMERLAHNIKEKESRFECLPMLVGSADEETKVILSADFDYNFRLTKLSQLCKVFPHPLGPTGYFELKRKSNDDTTSQNDETFDCFFNSDQYLLTQEVNSRFQIILEEVLSNANFWKDEHLLEWKITDIDLKKTGKLAGLCKTVRLTMLRPIIDGEGDELFVNISIDIVACIYVEDWWPRDPLPVCIATAVNTNGCTLVFDRPHFDPSNPRDPGFRFSETFARISFAPVERRIIKESSPVIKAAYMVCKMILYRQSKITYQLKTCFLFCLEVFNNRNVSEARNEVESMRSELAFWVERIMFCFVEFSQHDVYPCYLMPSFRQPAEGLFGDYEDLESREADMKNVNSDLTIPCNYSEAYDLYLDLCPDNAAIDIPINQENCGLVEGTLNVNHDPMWKQFDRKEFIRKLSSRSFDKQCNSSMTM